MNLDQSSPFHKKSNLLMFCAMKEPSKWNDADSLAFGGMRDEWDALFYEALNCPMPSRDIPYIEGCDMKEWQKLVCLSFQQAIPEYPLLGRVWDYYIDVWYAPEEIAQLRAECVAAQNKAKGIALAEKALEQFLYACDKALEKGFGLELRGP